MLSENALEIKSLDSFKSNLNEVSGAEVRLLFQRGRSWSDSKKKEQY